MYRVNNRRRDDCSFNTNRCNTLCNGTADDTEIGEARNETQTKEWNRIEALKIEAERIETEDEKFQDEAIRIETKAESKFENEVDKYENEPWEVGMNV